VGKNETEKHQQSKTTLWADPANRFEKVDPPEMNNPEAEW
jgi:hypothetical protein